MPTSLTIEARLFERCFSDYITDWSGLVIGIEGRGQTRDQFIDDICDEVSATTDDDEFSYGDYAYDLLRTALRETIKPNARFWPHDDDGNDVNTDLLPDAELPEEQSQYWVRILVTTSPLCITLSQNDDDDGMVTAYCEDKEAAEHDQTIEGSQWECPGDLDVAYASFLDRPTLYDDLVKEGYDVDVSEYSPPTAEDMARWGAKYLAANGE